MKKNIYCFIIFLFQIFLQTNIFAQASSVIEVYSGYGHTLYNMAGYNSKGFMPLGIRAAFGTHGIQLGLDYNSTIVPPKFKFTDAAVNELLYTESIKNNYLGLMLRGHMADDPRDFAVIVRGGIGYYFSKSVIHYSDYYLANFPGANNVTSKFNNSLGYNFALGFSFPLYQSPVHFTIEGQYNYNPRKDFGVTSYFTSWEIQAGISYNFFGSYDLSHYNYHQ